MTDFVILDIAISVIFVLLTVSIIASAFVEAVSSLSGWRAAGLERGLRAMMGGGVSDCVGREVRSALGGVGGCGGVGGGGGGGSA
ncbi:MAG: hypothetical protein AAF899_18440, partial [Pseudomonadota bacterium]